MSLVRLFVPAEVAHDTVSELGELGNVQFKDVCMEMHVLVFIYDKTSSLTRKSTHFNVRL